LFIRLTQLARDRRQPFHLNKQKRPKHSEQTAPCQSLKKIFSLEPMLTSAVVKASEASL
jgi:hypothetical protein